MSEQVWWYTARASGLVAWWLLAFAVAWGVLYRSKLLSGRTIPKWLLATHRFTGGTAVTFTGIHIAALVADSYVHFGVADLFVPYASDWKSGAVAWGIVGFWLLAAVQISSWAMKQLPRRLWLVIHLTSYPLFVSATLHAATAGTDARNRLWTATVALALVLTIFLVSFRILGDPRRSRRSVARDAIASGTSTRGRTDDRIADAPQGIDRPTDLRDGRSIHRPDPGERQAGVRPRSGLAAPDR